MTQLQVKELKATRESADGDALFSGRSMKKNQDPKASFLVRVVVCGCSVFWQKAVTASGVKPFLVSCTCSSLGMLCFLAGGGQPAGGKLSFLVWGAEGPRGTYLKLPAAISC